MSVSTPPSPTPSTASDDFVAVIDAELLAASSSDDEVDVDVEVQVEEEEEVGGIEIVENGNGANSLEDDFLSSKRLKMHEQEDVSATDNQCPPHPGFMWGVCIRCGKSKPPSEPGDSNVALKYIHEELELTEEEVDRIREKELQQVLAQKKLFLILDLDHTMLNSARFLDIQPDEADYLDNTYFTSDMNSSEGPIQAGLGGLYKLYNLNMWTKLRPFAHKFLEEASKMFEMYVYTMGERMYAQAMAKLLDPTGRLFKGRVISQNDSTRRHSKDLDIVLGAESAALILDDTEVVWPKHRQNLILMERYHFFSSSCKNFSINNPSLSQAQRDESESEGSLSNALNVLRIIHHNFFNATLVRKRSWIGSSCDVREVARERRRMILSGCKIVFSRIFPVGCGDPENHPLWKLSEELGAECVKNMDERVSHVIGLDKGTDKAKWAKQNSKYLVHPSWIEGAQYLWCRPNEEEYPVRDGQTRCPVFTFSKTLNVPSNVILSSLSSSSS